MRMLQVVPNPHRTLDADGNPIAVFPCHMRHAPGEYVGATKTLNVLQPAKFVDLKTKSGTRREVAQFDRSRAVFTFSIEPVSVPGSGEIGAYYRKGVKSGAILAADAETAEACGVPFVPVAEALEAQKKEAAKKLARQCGNVPVSASQSKPASVVTPQ